MKPKVLLVGTGLNVDLIKDILSEDFNVEQFWVKNWIDKLYGIPKIMFHNDLFYCVYARSVTRLFRRVTTLNHKLKKNILVHVVGSDTLFYEKKENMEKLKNVMNKHNVQLMYASKDLKEELQIEGDIVPIPIKDFLFFKDESVSQKRDVLFYCPSYNPAIYKEDKIRQYITDHQDEQITIIGGACGLQGDWNYPNVQAINTVEFKDMPLLYQRHRKLIRNTIHDGEPKMIYEALLSGCEVFWNEKKVSSVPDEMRWETGRKLIVDKVWTVLTN